MEIQLIKSVNKNCSCNRPHCNKPQVQFHCMGRVFSVASLFLFCLCESSAAVKRWFTDPYCCSHYGGRSALWGSVCSTCLCTDELSLWGSPSCPQARKVPGDLLNLLTRTWHLTSLPKPDCLQKHFEVHDQDPNISFKDQYFFTCFFSRATYLYLVKIKIFKQSELTQLFSSFTMFLVLDWSLSISKIKYVQLQTC